MTDGWSAERPTEGVVIYQPRRGFRYGAEAFWLAGLAMERAPATAVDLGTGSGIVAWLLAARGVDVRAVEAAPEWVEAQERTAAESRVAGRVRYERVDVRAVEAAPERRVDVVVSNPPFFPAGSGPAPADALARAARFETRGGLADFVSAAARVVAPHGRVWVVVPREREGDVDAADGLALVRRIRVGRRRTIVELGPAAERQADEDVDEGSRRVAGWYAAVGARWTAPPGERVREVLAGGHDDSDHSQGVGGEPR